MEENLNSPTESSDKYSKLSSSDKEGDAGYIGITCPSCPSQDSGLGETKMMKRAP